MIRVMVPTVEIGNNNDSAGIASRRSVPEDGRSGLFGLTAVENSFRLEHTEGMGGGRVRTIEQEKKVDMNLLITGADRSLGQLAVGHFKDVHRLRITGTEPSVDGDDYRPVDLREPGAVAPLVEGIQAILHLAVYEPVPLTGPGAEQERLDVAARGTYVLLQEARKAGVERVVLASRLALMAAYPEDYVVDENWQPEPAAEAESLAPYLSEIVCREFAREGGICTICLRFGALGEAEGTAETDALQALDGSLALVFENPGYRWHLFHVSRSARFPMRAALEPLGFEQKGGA